MGLGNLEEYRNAILKCFQPTIVQSPFKVFQASNKRKPWKNTKNNLYYMQAFLLGGNFSKCTQGCDKSLIETLANK